mgnify:CR=1 FL=1
MSSANPSSAFLPPRVYSLDDLTALNDEIIALVRSGVPLERGLTDACHELRGRTGRLVEAVAQRVERGESLDQAVASPELNLPEVYAAIVRAGVRSGRLPAALEQLSTTARRITEMRRIVTMAAMYPLVVTWVGCSLFAWVGPMWARLMQEAQQVQRVELSWPAQFGIDFAVAAGPYVTWLPPLMLLAIVVWYLVVGQVRRTQASTRAWWGRWLPGLGRLLYYSTAATFCEVLGLLVEHEVPLDEALLLAGATAGDPKLQADAAALAERIKSGQRIDASEQAASRIPGLVRWMLSSSDSSGRSVSAIRTAAEDYHGRAVHLMEWLRIFTPILLVVSIGGVLALVFALTVFGPWTSFIHSVAESVGQM